MKELIKSFNTLIEKIESAFKEKLGYNVCVLDSKIDAENYDYYLSKRGKDTILWVMIDNEFEPYIVSSIGMLGINNYIATIENYDVIMAYPDDCMWDETTIFILQKHEK
jgi:hypothetical protein